ncbi:MAG: hypothetical protein SFV81_11635, partial [Pirellulaceae bacterium]|nr:hypothetical protein [Pirellulaceae bacterium]
RMATRAEVVSSLRFAESQHPGRLVLELLEGFRGCRNIPEMLDAFRYVGPEMLEDRRLLVAECVRRHWTRLSLW